MLMTEEGQTQAAKALEDGVTRINRFFSSDDGANSTHAMQDLVKETVHDNAITAFCPALELDHTLDINILLAREDIPDWTDWHSTVPQQRRAAALYALIQSNAMQDPQTQQASAPMLANRRNEADSAKLNAAVLEMARNIDEHLHNETNPNRSVQACIDAIVSPTDAIASPVVQTIIVTLVPDTALPAVEEQAPQGTDYVPNTNTHRFQHPGCNSVLNIKESNREFFNGTREEVLAMG